MRRASRLEKNEKQSSQSKATVVTLRSSFDEAEIFNATFDFSKRYIK